MDGWKRGEGGSEGDSRKLKTGSSFKVKKPCTGQAVESRTGEGQRKPKRKFEN